jgi:hypothetical protein
MCRGDQDMNPLVSDAPYPAEMVTPQDRKNVNVSRASGAAPVIAMTTSSSPIRTSTGEITSARTRPHSAASESGIFEPSLRSVCTRQPSARASSNRARPAGSSTSPASMPARSFSHSQGAQHHHCGRTRAIIAPRSAMFSQVPPSTW